MCEPSAVPIIRDPALRSRAAALRAEGLFLKTIGERLGVSTTTTRLLLLPPPPDVFEVPPEKLCRHCHRGRVTRPKGLCWACSMNPGIRTQYGPVSKFGQRGIAAPRGNRPLPSPTNAVPGTEQKLLSLIERAERGQRLWHPADGPGDLR